jgi:hypothetical protein
MSRELFSTDRRHRVRSVAADAGNDRESERFTDRGSADNTAAARGRREREDPCGRHSLTGLEFRRQRSI